MPPSRISYHYASHCALCALLCTECTLCTENPHIVKSAHKCMFYIDVHFCAQCALCALHNIDMSALQCKFCFDMHYCAQCAHCAHCAQKDTGFTKVHSSACYAILCTLCTLCTMCTFVENSVHCSANGNVEGCSMQRQASFQHSFMPPYISQCAA